MEEEESLTADIDTQCNEKDSASSSNVPTEIISEATLSPWQKWLLKKEVDKREQKKFLAKKNNVGIPRKQINAVNNQKTQEEKEKIVQEWIMKKEKAMKESRRLQALALQEQLSKEQHDKEITATMAELKFKAWKKKKYEEAKATKNTQKESSLEKSAEQIELYQNAYSRWLQTVREREKQQLAFRKLIVSKGKSPVDHNRKQPSPRRRSKCTTTRSILFVSSCSKMLEPTKCTFR